jgi:DNA modification methylase
MNFIEFGDCREIMRDWKREGIKAQMCVTSPPYYGLRDYGHEGQIGLEQTPDDYIKAMVEVFRCVWDVLNDDGTLWLNIGDSYAGAGYSNHKGIGGTQRKDSGKQHRLSGTGYKNKDLIGIPWMLAFALRADGWYLRQDIIWHKPNPMPESVRDRCTKAHEYIFLLSKSERYFFDSDAIKEPLSDPSRTNFVSGSRTGGLNKDRNDNNKAEREKGKIYENKNKRSVWSVPVRAYQGAHFATFPPALIEPCILAGSRPSDIVLDPFMGSGTTAAVAKQQGRNYMGCELNEDYWPLQEERIRAVG